MSTGTPFLDSKRNYDIQYTHDTQGLKEFNKKNMTLTMPDLSATNKNVPAALHQQYGCQFVCMNYPKLDSNMEYYNNFFSENGTAFVLKPSPLRYRVTKIPNPKPQNPKVSYAKKSISLPDSHKEPTNSRNYSNSRKFFEVKKTRMLWWNSYK